MVLEEICTPKKIAKSALANIKGPMEQAAA
jgi:hypothetical protein